MAPTDSPPQSEFDLAIAVETDLAEAPADDRVYRRSRPSASGLAPEGEGRTLR
jgi:hypothetical protein